MAETDTGGDEITTIGHSSHEPEAFLALLERWDVQMLVDVRRHPGSRRVPWTNADALEQLLAASSIGYMHLETLGGRRRPTKGSPNDGWRVAQFQGYADHLASVEFTRGLDELEDAARRHRTAVMCAEALWWRCHRRLLSDVLVVRGWRVVHIDSRGEGSEHGLTRFARIDDAQITYPTSAGEA
jgi:uncharacterized protein (DUF488 family)